MEEETKPEDVEEEQKGPTEKEQGAEWFFMILFHITIKSTMLNRAVHKYFIDSWPNFETTVFTGIWVPFFDTDEAHAIVLAHFA